MALYKIGDRYPDYKERFAEGDNVIGVDVYARTSDGDEKVGSIDTVLVDEAGHIRYLVIDTGFWVFGKKVLLPIGRCIDDPDEQDRIYAAGLSKRQVENLPEYRDELVVDCDYEERVRSIYLMPGAGVSAPVEMSVPVKAAETPGTDVQPVSMPAAQPFASEGEPGAHSEVPDLYAINDNKHRRLRLYEERLVADKQRKKTGEVTVTKRVETERADASVPVQKEKVIIEIESVAGSTRINMPDGRLQEREAAQVDVYEERADIHKDPVVRQEVNIRKEAQTDVVTVHETLQREELDVHQEGTPDVVDRT